MENDFFTNLNVRLAALLTECLREPSAGFFRRPTEVSVGTPEDSRPMDYGLYSIGHEVLQNDRGTFSCPEGDENILVLRTPSLVRSTYVLSANQLTWKQKMRAEDRLMALFFEKRTIEPFLPAALEKYPGLLEKLRARPAEMSVRGDLASGVQSGPNALERPKEFRFSFDYVALYHSGGVLRRDSRVRTRTIEFPNENRDADRSTL